VLGWRGDVLGAAAVVGATLVLAPRLAPVRPPGARQRLHVDRFLVALGLAGICAGAIGNALPAFTVDAATTAGMGHNSASLLLAVGGGAAVAGRLAAGWLADRRRSVGIDELIATTLIGAVAFAALAIGHGSRAVFVVATLVAFFGGWGWAGVIHFATMRARPVGAGTASGYVLAWVYTGNVIGPVAIGATVDATSYTVAWVVSAVVLVLSAVAAAVARRAGPAPGA
jgi:predicted MFS family arabinose efflux permease